MPLAIIQTPHLSQDQKNRVGNRIIEALHAEGFPPSAILVLFKLEDADIYVDGGLVYERPAAPLPAPSESHPVAAFPAPEARARARRSKADLDQLRTQLIKVLQVKGLMSSFEAQTELGIKDDENGAAILRRLFGELEAEGLIVKQGQKRGTRYAWKGFTNIPSPETPAPILLKKAETEAE